MHKNTKSLYLVAAWKEKNQSTWQKNLICDQKKLLGSTDKHKQSSIWIKSWKKWKSSINPNKQPKDLSLSSFRSPEYLVEQLQERLQCSASWRKDFPRNLTSIAINSFQESSASRVSTHDLFQNFFQVNKDL